MVHNRLFEGGVEVTIVKKDVWVMEPLVEVSLHRLDRLDYTFQLLVPSQYNKGSIRSGLFDLGYLTASHEDLIVPLADFPATQISN